MTTVVNSSRSRTVLWNWCLTLVAALKHAFARRPWRSVPVVMQSTAYECGAASLAMVLGYHGRVVELSELTETSTAGREGITAAAIARDARRMGLMVKTYTATCEKLKTLPLPAIVYWHFNHFMVVEKWTRKGVQAVDPARGRRLITHDHFDKGFTGIVLTFQPGLSFERKDTSVRGRGRALLATAFGVPGIWSLLGQVLLTSVLIQFMGLASPLFMKVLLDHFVPAGAVDAMEVLLLGLVTVIGSRWAFSLLRGRTMLILKSRIDWCLYRGVFAHLLNLPLKFFQRRSAADVLQRMGGAGTIRDLITSRTIGVILDACFVSVYLAVLLHQAPNFAALAVGMGLLEGAFVVLTRKRVQQLLNEILAAGTECSTVMSEAVHGIETVKIAGAEPVVLDRWSDKYARMLNIGVKRANTSMMMDTGMTIIQMVTPLAVIYMGARQVIEGTMTLGTMLALNTLVGGVVGPLSSLASTVRRLQTAAVHLRRLWDILGTETEQEGQVTRGAPRFRGEIELRKVTFRYNEGADPVLKDIDLTVAAGQKVALVGRTGSGKSTLAALLLGLHDPTQGEILYDGQPLRGFDRASVRAQFGSVPQEAHLFTGSIRENIALGDESLSLEEIERVAEQACLLEDVDKMPMGFATHLAGGGRSLSGGQKQRIAIARALARKPAILLLDEATSSLDAVTEAKVDRNLNQLSCTRVVIAHRLSTIRNADLILVLDEGCIVERGTHEQLLARGGRYAELIAIQGEAPAPALQALPAALGQEAAQ